MKQLGPGMVIVAVQLLLASGPVMVTPVVLQLLLRSVLLSTAYVIPALPEKYVMLI